MRPITVSVGPLGAVGSAVAVATSQQPVTPGQLVVNGAPSGGSNVNAFQGQGTIAGNVLTVTTTTSGAMGPGWLMGSGLPAGLMVTGPGPSANTWLLSPTPAPALAPISIRLNTVLTFDVPRQVLITTTEPPGNTVTVYGTNAAGQPITEALATTGANLSTRQNFATVTRVALANAPAAALSVGTASVATSDWVYFDPWSMGTISKQCDITGTPTYSLQISNDDPNSPTNPVPASAMNWLNDPDATFENATTAVFGYWSFTPLWARVVLTAGVGSVQATFVQQDGGW